MRLMKTNLYLQPWFNISKIAILFFFKPLKASLAGWRTLFCMLVLASRSDGDGDRVRLGHPSPIKEALRETRLSCWM